MASLQLVSVIGTGPFEIFIREVNEPETTNRYVSGTLPNVITFDEIKDGLSHEYIIIVKSPSCNDFVGKFPLLSSCEATPSIYVQQDCENFVTGNLTIPIKVTAGLTNNNHVVIKIYDGATLLFSELIPTGVEKTYNVPNNKDIKVRGENPLYVTCFTEVLYHTLCTESVNCDFTFTIQNPTPDQVVSVTPTPTITSASISGSDVTLTGTAPCNGNIAIYKQVGSSFNMIGSRNILVVGGNWTTTVTGTGTDVFKADLLCSTFTQPSVLSNAVTAGQLLPPTNIVVTPTADGVNISYDTQEDGVHVRIDVTTIGDTNPPANSENTNGEWSFRTDDLRATIGTYSFTATLPDTKQYYARFLVYKEGRLNADWVKVGPFSKTSGGGSQWLSPTGVTLTPITGGVRVSFTAPEDGVSVRLDTSVQPGVNPDPNPTDPTGIWRYVGVRNIPTAGTYSIDDTNVTDTGQHYVRLIVYGSPKADSPWSKYGPFTKL